MHDEHRENNLPLSAWLLVLACVAAAIIAFSAGTAYTGINQARLVAAKASLGQIESTYLLADRVAADEGLKPPADGVESLIRSYESEGKPSAYEQFVLSAMLDAFGANCDFDFAVSRYEDISGTHTRILYFPARGRTDTQKDRYYTMMDGNIVENN